MPMPGAKLYHAIRERGAVADLTGRALLLFTGADRVRYLNGQLSNDIRKMQPQESMHACVLTIKGRLEGDLFVSGTADFLCVDAEPSLRETMAARLERYIIADDVALHDATDECALLHLMGAAAEAAAPEGARLSRNNRFGIPGVDLFVPAEQREPLLRELDAHLPLATEPVLELLRIESGIPRWGFELGEETLPPEAGLDKTAIDFHKGCYVGQEVISRIKSVGHVNRTLRGFVARQPLTPGAKLFSPESPGKPAGELTSASYSFVLEKEVALGYLKRGVASPAVLTSDGVEAEVRELPLLR